MMTDCNGCVYWKEDHSGMGWCKRHAPSPVTTTEFPDEDTFSIYGFWPKTHFEDECGEGKGKRELPS
jgi:hypothetical protein